MFGLQLSRLGAAISAAYGYSPLSLFSSGEVGAFFDPSDLTTMFQDSAGTIPVTGDGQPVGKILDKSGRGNHATQATAANRPLYRTDGTYHWLKFDGIDDWLSTAAIDFTSTDKLSVFSGVMRNNNTLGFICEFSSTVNSNNGSFNLLSGTDGVTTDGYTFKTRGDANTTIGARVNNVGSPVKSVISTSGDIPADLTTMRVNTIAGINGTLDQGAGNLGTYPLYIGSRAGGSAFINGNIYSLIVRGALSTADEITATETWVNSKTGAY